MIRSMQQHKHACSMLIRHASTIPIPDFIRAKELGKLVKKNTTAIAKAFCTRNNRKFYFQHEGESYKFDRAKDIVLPYAAVETWMKSALKGKTAIHDLVEPDLLQPPPHDDDILPATSTSTPPLSYTRNPVIAVMGHINHGKTSLLDTLRGSNVARGEVESITQTINVCESAITPSMDATFLDTPGHFHFTRMRNNAAGLADMVLLLVSLEEGSLMQTEESIGAIEELGLPVIVCLNKSDIAAENVAALTADLRLYNALEDAPMLPITALDRSSLIPLLERIDLLIQSPAVQAQLQSPALSTVSIPRGIVLEVMDVRGRGLVQRVLIQEGQINHGDHFVCGLTCGKIRLLSNMNGETVKSGTPGQVLDVMVKNTSGNKDAPLEMGFHIVSQAQAERIVELR